MKVYVVENVYVGSIYDGDYKDAVEHTVPVGIYMNFDKAKERANKEALDCLESHKKESMDYYEMFWSEYSYEIEEVNPNTDDMKCNVFDNVMRDGFIYGYYVNEHVGEIDNRVFEINIREQEVIE